ncbi:MAG: hypothetical protein D6808_01350 [Candidatus Dadabacteria bacterium]|nr:MAG: hypothetical protein D6808_01350 [Candidatus Dadabacteria bacterium]
MEGTQLTPTLLAEDGVVIRKVRRLPVPGNISVKKGDRVGSRDMIGSAELPGELRIVRVPETLGIEVDEALTGFRNCGIEEGVQVEYGAKICEYPVFFGLLKATCYSPAAGTVEFISKKNAHIGIRMKSTPLVLSSYIAGEVVEVEKGHSAVIEGRGAIVQGIFGVGGERTGKLELLDVGCESLVTESDIPSMAEGKILVGGMCPTVDAIKKAAKSGAVGLVTGSILSEVLSCYLGYDLGAAITGDEDIPLTLIITEGFGELAISESAYSILSRYAGHLASINGATQVRAGAIRPEVLITEGIEVSLCLEKTIATYSVGKRVRIIRYPYFGRYGVIEEMPEEPEAIATGAKVRVFRLRLDTGELITVPRVNVELA